MTTFLANGGQLSRGLDYDPKEHVEPATQEANEGESSEYYSSGGEEEVNNEREDFSESREEEPSPSSSFLPPVPTPRSHNSSRSTSSRQSTGTEGAPSDEARFWDEVNTFLTKPAPNIKSFDRDASALPKLPKDKVGSEVSHVQRSSQAKSRYPGKKVPEKVDRPLNQELLREAFAYVEQLQKGSRLDPADPEDDEEEDGQADRSNVAPQGRRGQTSSDKKAGQPYSSKAAKPKKKASKKVVKKSNATRKASNTSVSSATEGPGMSASSGKDESALNGSLLEELTKNFQEGLTLKALRAELMESQMKLNASRAALQGAARDFFQSHQESH